MFLSGVGNVDEGGGVQSLALGGGMERAGADEVWIISQSTYVLFLFFFASLKNLTWSHCVFLSSVLSYKGEEFGKISLLYICMWWTHDVCVWYKKKQAPPMKIKCLRLDEERYSSYASSSVIRVEILNWYRIAPTPMMCMKCVVWQFFIYRPSTKYLAKP